MTTFIWSPAPGASVAKKPRVRNAQFNGGYSQRVGDGINTIVRIWTITFNSSPATIDAIEAFLDARAGAESFDWTPPSGNIGKWVCADYSRTLPDVNMSTFSATFTEVFGD